MNPVLSLDDFKTWLESKDEYEIVGERRDSCKCPLANWIRDINNLSSREVGVNKYSILFINNEYKIPTPSWMKIFINYTDVPSNPLCNVEEALFTLTKIKNNL